MSNKSDFYIRGLLFAGTWILWLGAAIGYVYSRNETIVLNQLPPPLMACFMVWLLGSMIFLYLAIFNVLRAMRTKP